jgi:transposase-like protein
MGQESKKGKYPREFRDSALRRLSTTTNVSGLCRELGISRQLLYFWRERQQREQRKQTMVLEQGLLRENAELKQALVKKTLEADFLKAACEKVAALRQTGTGSGATASGKSSGNGRRRKAALG